MVEHLILNCSCKPKDVLIYPIVIATQHKNTIIVAFEIITFNNTIIAIIKH